MIAKNVNRVQGSPCSRLLEKGRLQAL